MARKTVEQEPAEMLETAEVTMETGNDPWKEMVEIKLPKAPKGEPNYEIASVNGRVFKIKKGEKVKVPAPIAEVIEHSIEAQEEADEYMESVLSEDE